MKTLDRVNSNKENYDVFHALKKMHHFSDEVLALATCIIEDFTYVNEFLSYYEDKEGEENAFEKALVEYFNSSMEGWMIGDIIGIYEEIDDEYLTKIITS